LEPTEEDYDLAPALTGLSHLVIVACHAIYLPGPALGATEEEWDLQPYQRGRSPQNTFLAHIEKGVSVARADPAAMLMFSGGETRRGVGPRVEAAGYFVRFPFRSPSLARSLG